MIHPPRLRSHVLVALHVLVLVSVAWLVIQSRYEDRLFQWFVDKTVSPEWNEQDKALALMHRTTRLVRPSAELFSNRPRTTFKGWGLFSADQALLEGYGGCGAFSHVLARALRVAGIDARLAQMKVGDVWAGHIMIEANLGGQWVVLDPLYDLVFQRPDGSLATFEDVSRSWAYYAAQVPPDYDPAFRYEDVRYANWDKIPVIGRAARSVLSAALGEERASTFPLRVYMLNAYKMYAVLLLVAYVAFLLIPSLVLVARSRHGQTIARAAHVRGHLERR